MPQRSTEHDAQWRPRRLSPRNLLPETRIVFNYCRRSGISSDENRPTHVSSSNHFERATTILSHQPRSIPDGKCFYRSQTTAQATRFRLSGAINALTIKDSSAGDHHSIQTVTRSAASDAIAATRRSDSIRISC